MIEDIFTEAVKVKPWRGSLQERSKAVRHLAVIPNTFIMVETLTTPNFFKPYSYLNEESKDIASQLANIIADSGMSNADLNDLSRFLSQGLADDERCGHIIGEMEIRLIPMDFVSNTNDLRY